MSIRKELGGFVTNRNKEFQHLRLKLSYSREKEGDIVRKISIKMVSEKKCNKNVIKMKKGVAFCKQLCYNSGTYIREKE